MYLNSTQKSKAKITIKIYVSDCVFNNPGILLLAQHNGRILVCSGMKKINCYEVKLERILRLKNYCNSNYKIN